MNGDLTFESEYNKGSTFILAVPLKINLDIEKNNTYKNYQSESDRSLIEQSSCNYNYKSNSHTFRDDCFSNMDLMPTIK